VREAFAADLALAAEAIAARGGDLGKPLHLLAITSSTSDEARRAAKAGAPHGATWVAEEQTAGRGRQGRAWVGRRGESLLFSVIVRTRCPPARLPQLALVAGLAVRDAAARALPGVDVRIKWPNDVVVGRKKLAGILVESTLAGRDVEALVVGVGVNVHTREFPEEIAARATSISLLRTGPPHDLRSQVLADILHGLSRDLVLVAGRGLGLVHARLAAADALRGERVASEAGAGRAEGVDPEGRLLVRTDDGALARWSAGEVHLA
jgi:BirA family transcriptional regulator, biotin operon repressor / biotin---[acetyl-CoA-carboxylase] ligase